MTVKELIAALSNMPEDAHVTVRGYEGGVDIINSVYSAKRLKLNHIQASWEGKYRYSREDDKSSSMIAVHLCYIPGCDK